MASVYSHPKSGIYHVSFWYEGEQYRKSLQTRNKRKAQDDAKAVQKAVNAFKSGRDKEGLRLIRQGIPMAGVDGTGKLAWERRQISDGAIVGQWRRAWEHCRWHFET